MRTREIYGGNPVLPVGSSGSWDEQEANSPTVIKDGDLFKMWYHGCDPDYTRCSIGYATSPDGIQWTKYEGNPVLGGTAGEWDENYVWSPAVVKTGSGYEMWYYSHGRIGRVTSSDSVNWTMYAGNPVLSQSWDGAGVSGQTVLLEDATYKMWFRGGPRENHGIGYAESTNGITWTLSTSNPVLTPGTPVQWGEPVMRFEAGSDGAVLDGFTITGGNVGQDGGGITVYEASPVIRSCVIRDNTAQGQDEWGGGVRVGDASFTMINSLVVGNSGRPAIHGNSASMTLTNVTVADNGPEGGILLNVNSAGGQ